MAAGALDRLVGDEARRCRVFPVCRKRVFMAHAAVAALPAPVAAAMAGWVRRAAVEQQEFGEVLRVVADTRALAAALIGADADEIALLGPTSLGLSLVALGLPWEPGDEVVCYPDDYPANVYPWLELARRGVVVRRLKPALTGDITPELVAGALTARTRLVALASANFLTGQRIDIDAIGRLLRARGVLFCVDAIQTLGAFPLAAAAVDFLSADAHKWLLGPVAVGIVYVRRERFDLLRPALLGAWNVESPNYLAQDEVRFVETARRYEPGTLNAVGIYGLRAALRLLAAMGAGPIAARIMALKTELVGRLQERGFIVLGPAGGDRASGITTCRQPRVAAPELFARLAAAGVVASLRYDRGGGAYLRFSPHFYNTVEEIERALKILDGAR